MEAADKNSIQKTGFCQVAGGLIFSRNELLLVKNDRRYSKTSDWSTPGGVIDRGEAVLKGLGREVLEETGLIVHGWKGPVYDVQVDFVDRGFTLGAQIFLAVSWDGELVLEDPDRIVTDAVFCSLEVQTDLLKGSPVWVREPLLEWQNKLQKTQNSKSPFKFKYAVGGLSLEDSHIQRYL